MDHIIDHICVNVTSWTKAKAFYTKALAPLDIKPLADYGKVTGFGRGQKPEFWIGEGAMAFQKPEHLQSITPLHVCFSAPSREVVDEFYKEALAAGAKDNGPPGIRAQYHPGYYGAFVIDPDGHNVEAVCHG